MKVSLCIERIIKVACVLWDFIKCRIKRLIYQEMN